MLLMGRSAFAYPNLERGNVDVDLSQTVQFAISSDNQSLYIAYGNTFKIFDTGTFALAATQPFPISGDTTKYPGNYKGVIYFSSQNAVFLPMDNGTLMRFNLASVGTAPTIITIASGKTLGNGVADTVGGDAVYIINSTDTSVMQYVLSTGKATPIAILPAVSAAGFAVTPQLNQIAFSPQGTVAASEVYLTTTTNMLIYFNLQTLSPQITQINSGNTSLTDVLQGVMATPNKAYVYVVDATANKFAKVQISNHSVVGSLVSLTPNNTPNQLLITDVTNPTGTYGYVAGVQGISIFDTSDNNILDLGVTSTDDEPLSVSGTGPMLASTDAYVYISAASGNIGVVSDNPWVTVNSVSYSGGASSSTALGVGGTATISFKADEAGTYVTRVGGNVSGNGTLVKDSYGSTNGTVTTANTSQTVAIPYNSNASSFQEGNNALYFFVADSAGNVGRRAATVAVDTPPGAVSVLGASFGNGKAYINFSRLTANDINHYNVYADTNATAVTTKTTVATTVTQGSESTLTGVVTGLTNGTLYYLAIEAVDNAGNVGQRVASLSAGGSITATPEIAVGPAGFTGEGGCTLIREAPLQAPIRRWGWFFDGRASLWQPTSPTTKRFIPAFYNWQGTISGGFLFREQIAAEVGVGFFTKTGRSIAAGSGALSQDTFKLITVPITIGGAYRFMYSRKMPVVPYVRGGFEMDYFYENDSGTKIHGLKKGLYGGGGLQVPVSKWLDMTDAEMHRDTQIYLVFEALYKWVNDFGGKGLNLSGALYSAGFLMTF